MTQPGIKYSAARDRASERAPEFLVPYAILDVGTMNDEADQVTLFVVDDMALAAIDLLSRVIASGPPRSVVLTG